MEKAMKTKRPTFSKGTVKRVFSYLSPYKGRLFLVLLCIIISSLSNVAVSYFSGLLVDTYFPDPSSNLPLALGVMAIILGAGCIVSYISHHTMAVIGQVIMKKVRDDMYNHMQDLSVKYFDQHSKGDIMSLYINDTDTLHQLICQSIPEGISSLLSIITVFVVMVMSSIYLTLLIIGFLLIMMLITKTVGGKSGKYFIKQQQSIGKLNGYIEEMIQGQKVVKVFCHEDGAKDGFDKVNNQLRKDATSAHSFANVFMPIMGNLGHVQYTVIAIVGATMVIMGAQNLSITGFALMTPGLIVSFLQYARNFSNPVSQISNQINSIVMAFAGAERIFNLLDEAKEVDDGYVTLCYAKEDENGNITESETRTGKWAWKHYHKADDTTTYVPLAGKIDMLDVDFGYTPDKLVLHDVTLHAKPGQKIAFVGSTGAGKTTITNLINRFYDIADGKIRYDDININKIKKADLRRSLGIVLQDTNLFTGTVMENIRYGRLDATDEEVIEASKLANAHDFIIRLPEGYDTMLTSDGANLSQGQRQLLSIARAAVADAPVMILDEATSSIDTRTEKIVQEGTDKLMEGRTVFIIAHRLSTVRNADVIMVLEKGRIIESGNHEELLKKHGRYYQLYTGSK